MRAPIAGARASLERVRLRIRGHYTTGTVVDVDVDVDEDPDRYTRHTPTVDFVTRNGDRRVERLLHPVGIQHDVGARIRILSGRTAWATSSSRISSRDSGASFSSRSRSRRGSSS
ncbi:hypothetical protein [Frankia sp. CiP1_Cm_nod1]|uniref:hypothetical protein n=1 Tax=Frankia sp. CiP1_Cm_nod1 TaxID=2897160 RepID=UPI002025974C